MGNDGRDEARSVEDACEGAEDDGSAEVPAGDTTRLLRETLDTMARVNQLVEVETERHRKLAAELRRQKRVRKTAQRRARCLALALCRRQPEGGRGHSDRPRAVPKERLRQLQKLEAVGQLAGGVAHDFNNLLVVISGHARMLLERLDADSPLRSAAKEIVDAAERAGRLTRRLLAFGRRQPLERETLEVNRLVNSTLTMLRRLLGEDIDVQCLPSDEDLHVRADATEMEQILLNLAVNARDAMPGGGKLTIRTGRDGPGGGGEESEAAAEPGSCVVLSVSDTGCGMDEQTRQRIFEPFYTTKEETGTGLGLATVYGIVKRYNGRIAVRSRPGRGTTVRILLPCAAAGEGDNGASFPCGRR